MNFLIEKNCSTFVVELYHTCRQIIVQLRVDYKTLVGEGISSEFISRAMSLMCVITMTQTIYRTHYIKGMMSLYIYIYIYIYNIYYINIFMLVSRHDHDRTHYAGIVLKIIGGLKI